MQRDLFHVEEEPAEWTRCAGLYGTCGTVWVHRSGWIVRHCGHPTALWPWYGLPPAEHLRAGEMLLTGGFGLGLAFRRAVDCKAAVEAQIARGVA